MSIRARRPHSAQATSDSSPVTSRQASDDAGTTRGLATFLAGIRFEALPQEVISRSQQLFVDWIASALAGRGARPIAALERVAAAMGPRDGPSEVLVSRRRTSPYFAALVNGASSHVVEQDDVHNAAVFHPGAVVWPAVIAAAQETGAGGHAVISAAVAGYEAGARTGTFLGRSHYRVFHTTGTAGTLAAAAAVAHLRQADAATMLHALGNAGTQAAGLWEFLRDAADSKQLHTGKAAADGLLAAYLACAGFTGASRILEGVQGMAAGMSSDADPRQLTEGLGARWAMLETSFKFHASCRHTHPSADALLLLMRTHHLRADDILQVRAHVYQAAIDVLAPAAGAHTVHQAKFSMGFVLALIAVVGHASISDFTPARLGDPALRDFLERVEMVPDAALEAAYPARWIGLVEVRTRDGHLLSAHVDEPKGDPGNPLNAEEIEDKARRLAGYAGAASPKEIEHIIARARSLADQPDVRHLLPRARQRA